MIRGDWHNMIEVANDFEELKTFDIKLFDMKPLRTFTSIVLAMLAFTANAQEGAWNGELDVMGTKLPLVFNFTTNGCTMDSPSQTQRAFPLRRPLQTTVR